MKDKYKDFIQKFPHVEKKKPLAPFTTLQVGGPADLYYVLTDILELPTIIETAKELNIPYFVLGGGSNTIFHENGFRGLIIHMKAREIRLDGNRIIADAGAQLSVVLQTALRAGLIGMEKFMGLPGTVGGAVRGNAGAFGIETKDVFEKALIFTEDQGLHEEGPDYFKFGYRSSTVKARNGKDIIVQVTYKLKKGDTKSAIQENVKVISSRLKRQPSGQNTGSFFKNPSPDQPAGKLLDEAGCKGLKMGNIQVSEQHANWIMNRGGATQTEVIKLMKTMRKKVKNNFGITLEPEVQFVDETGPIHF